MKTNSQNINRILISRTDAIGDVVLTLPMLAVLKEKFPLAQITFLGTNYTKAITDSHNYIESFINWDNLKTLPFAQAVEEIKKYNFDICIHVFPNKQFAKIAHKSKIPFRIGTSHRIFHWFTCNVKVNFSRKKSDLHESQLNMKLLKPLGLSKIPSLESISTYFSFKEIKSQNHLVQNSINNQKFNIVFHPFCNSGYGWPLENYKELIELLPEKKFNIILTGNPKESVLVKSLFNNSYPDNVIDLSGKLNLQELIELLNSVDGLIAASTGPLHIASALGKKTLGFYTMRKPVDPGRWQPIGKQASFIVYSKNDLSCDSINKISPLQIYEKIIAWKEKK